MNPGPPPPFSYTIVLTDIKEHELHPVNLHFAGVCVNRFTLDTDSRTLLRSGPRCPTVREAHAQRNGPTPCRSSRPLFTAEFDPRSTAGALMDAAGDPGWIEGPIWWVLVERPGRLRAGARRLRGGFPPREGFGYWNARSKAWE